MMDGEDVQRLPLPLDAESRRMLDTLVMHFYTEHSGLQRNKHRGLVVEMAIRMFYARTFPTQHDKETPPHDD
ncbi:MAG: hypothetical protein ACXWP0_04355 [Ktedonobacterales bacterium]